MSLDSFLKALVMFAVKDRTGKISPQKCVCMCACTFFYLFFLFCFLHVCQRMPSHAVPNPLQIEVSGTIG